MDKDKNKTMVSKKSEEIVQKPKVEDFDISKSLDEHMEENKTHVKKGINIKTIITYLLMIIIVVVCVLLLVHFCEDSIENLNKTTTTKAPNYQFLETTSKTTASVSYVKTTRVQTAATHTVFVGNTNHVASTKNFNRTNNVQIKTTKKTTAATKSTTKEPPKETTTTKNTTEPTEIATSNETIGEN